MLLIMELEYQKRNNLSYLIPFIELVIQTVFKELVSDYILLKCLQRKIQVEFILKVS